MNKYLILPVIRVNHKKEDLTYPLLGSQKSRISDNNWNKQEKTDNNSNEENNPLEFSDNSGKYYEKVFYIFFKKKIAEWN